MDTKDRTLSNEQINILNILKKNFGLSNAELDRILFLNERDLSEPWIPADLQEAIARQVGGFKNISVTHDKFVPELNQVIYIATITDSADRIFTRSGSAKIGETPNGFEIDIDNLAGSRALNLALNAAGFNPFRAGSVFTIEELRQPFEVAPLSPQEQSIQQTQDESEARRKDLAQIHVLAQEKNLWVGKDDSRYREELNKNFGVRSSVLLDRNQRASVIAWLNNYRDESFLSAIPVGLREDALIA